jgi:hypothetical protein
MYYDIESSYLFDVLYYGKDNNIYLGFKSFPYAAFNH